MMIDRAEDWGLDNPLCTGCLQVFQADTKLRIVIYAFKDQTKLKMTQDNLSIFGQCPIEIKPGENIISFVDGVIDSSRYFVIRIKDPNSTRTTLVGIGFRDREIAFDFKTILNEYVKYIDRMDLASKMASSSLAEEEESGEHITKSSALAQYESHIPVLKEGEKIKVNVKHKKVQKEGSSSSSGSSGTSGFGGLKPPPPPGSTVFLIPSASKASEDELDQKAWSTSTPNTGNTAAAMNSDTAGDDDWTDFASS